MQFFEDLIGLRIDGSSGLLEMAFLTAVGLANLVFLVIRISALGGRALVLRGGVDDGPD